MQNQGNHAGCSPKNSASGALLTVWPQHGVVTGSSNNSSVIGHVREASIGVYIFALGLERGSQNVLEFQLTTNKRPKNNPRLFCDNTAPKEQSKMLSGPKIAAS